MPIDLEALVAAVGYTGLFIIIFAETGLLIGFFLPGDSLLITTGLLAQRGHLRLLDNDGVWFIIPWLILAAVLGDAVGYQIGKHGGRRLFTRDDSRWFHRRHLERARDFYDRHGGKTIVLARYLAIVRTFAPTVAGAAAMPYRKFALYNVFGGATWVTSMVLLGYFAGHAVPNVDALLLAILAVIIVASVAPAGWHLLREHRRIAREGRS